MRALPLVVLATAILFASAATVLVLHNKGSRLAAARDSDTASFADTVQDSLAQHQAALTSAVDVLGPSSTLRAVIATDAATVQDQIAHEGLQNLRKQPVYLIGRRSRPGGKLEVLASGGLQPSSTRLLLSQPSIARALSEPGTDAGHGALVTEGHALLYAVAPVVSFDRATHGFILIGELIDKPFLQQLSSLTKGLVVLSDGHRALAGVGAPDLQDIVGAVIGSESKYREHAFVDANWRVAARVVPIGRSAFLWMGASMSDHLQLIEDSANFIITLIWLGTTGAGLLLAFLLWRRSRTVTGNTGLREVTVPPTPFPRVTSPGAGRGANASPTFTPASWTSMVSGETNMFGRYRLLERIGSGGMAEVWTAVVTGAEGFRRPFVVKRIRRDLSANLNLVQPFIDEANLAAQLVHSNIVPVFDFGNLNGEYFIAQEYILGRDLGKITAALARDGRRLDTGLAIYICLETLKALDYAHTLTDKSGRPLGIVHRDISPSNILISSRGEVKLIDFGIAKSVSKVGQTETGTVKGNLRFMSPEQAQGLTVDGRSDLFSLAMSIFFTQAGESLYQGPSQYDLLLAAAHGPGQDGMARIAAALESPLRELLVPAFSVTVDGRYQSAQQFIEYTLPHSPVDGARRLAALLQDLFGEELRTQETQFASAFNGTGELESENATVQRSSPGMKQWVS